RREQQTAPHHASLHALPPPVSRRITALSAAHCSAGEPRMVDITFGSFWYGRRFRPALGDIIRPALILLFHSGIRPKSSLKDFTEHVWNRCNVFAPARDFSGGGGAGDEESLPPRTRRPAAVDFRERESRSRSRPPQHHRLVHGRPAHRQRRR